jgi:hypothetical protein
MQSDNKKPSIACTQKLLGAHTRLADLKDFADIRVHGAESVLLALRSAQFGLVMKLCGHHQKKR